MPDPLIWLILLPLAWATLAFVLGPARGAWLGMGGLAAQLRLAVDLARVTMTIRPLPACPWKNLPGRSRNTRTVPAPRAPR